MANNLKITLYNCKHFVSFGEKIKFIDELCLESDFLFLQELWLYKNDLSKLLSLGSSTDMIATSAMDESVHRVGHLFGGCAIVWRAFISGKVTKIETKTAKYVVFYIAMTVLLP